MSSLVSFLIDIILLSTAITYMVKFYKYRNMAEIEFIAYENRLDEVEAKRKEEEYVHESEMHMYKGENGELTPEIEGVRIEQGNLTKGQGQAGGVDLQPLLDKIEKIYKEKEIERNARFEAEKQMSLAIQRAQEIEQKMGDFKYLQDENIDLMKRIAGSLYKRINADLQQIK